MRLWRRTSRFRTGCRLNILIGFIFSIILLIITTSFQLKALEILYTLKENVNKPMNVTHNDIPHTIQKYTREDVKVLISRRHHLGMYSKVFGGDVAFFNPALIELPSTSKHDFLVIARLPHLYYENPEGPRYKSRVVIFFANFQPNSFGWLELKRNDNDTWSRDIEDPKPLPKSRCLEKTNLSRFFGFEDPKVFWTNQGEPLLVITHHSPEEGECQAISMIDLRSIAPELEAEFSSLNLPPIKYREPWHAKWYVGEGVDQSSLKSDAQKNWIPFQPYVGDYGKELFFSMNAHYPRLFRLDNSNDMMEYIKEGDSPTRLKNRPKILNLDDKNFPQTCVHDMFRMTGLYSNIHQSTPALSVTLCNRGECEPNIHNTVNFALVHSMHVEKLWYDRIIMTWNATRPFHYRSVSKPLQYFGASPEEFIWTGNMVYYWNGMNKVKDRSHGYLDDEILISFGIGDIKGGMIDVKANDLLEDHYYCEPVTDPYHL